MTEDQVAVRLVGGPPDWDGHTLTYPRHVIEEPRDQIGAYLISAHTPERDPDTEDTDPRAIYEPDPEPADPTVWRFRGWFPASVTDPDPRGAP